MGHLLSPCLKIDGLRIANCELANFRIGGLASGYWILDAGCWMLDAGCWMLDTGYWILDTGYWMLDT
ncbi:MAG: hypothetical protein JEZ11_18160 [Desulfobacterales bacterium]|nr:hypothetical protein [Desulfobacterales bacterium]